jgi:hypothetical protein
MTHRDVLPPQMLNREPSRFRLRQGRGSRSSDAAVFCVTRHLFDSSLSLELLSALSPIRHVLLIAFDQPEAYADAPVNYLALES